MISDEKPRWPVLEIFGPTVQGEGVLAGHISHFVRLAICNDRCTWCDTKYSWNRKQATEMSVDQIVSSLQGFPWAPWITISGGNPGIWPNLDVLIRAIRQNCHAQINVETQGTVYQKWMSRRHPDAPNYVTVSPKPPSSGVRFRPKAFEQILYGCHDYGQNLTLKVVIADETDYQWFRCLWDTYKQHMTRPVYLQPMTSQETDAEGQKIRLGRAYKWLCERVLLDADMLYDVIIIPQLHVLAWGNSRGK